MDKLESKEIIKRIQANEEVLDVLVNIEDFLDSLDLYAFRNWIDGEVVSGPDVHRYWVSITLKYPYRMMPEPVGGMRLVGHDCRVRFRRAVERKQLSVRGADDVTMPSDPYSRHHYRPKLKKTKVWLVTIQIPRRFIDDIRDAALDQYDVSLDDIEDASDEDMQQEEAAPEEASLPPSEPTEPPAGPTPGAAG